MHSFASEFSISQSNFASAVFPQIIVSDVLFGPAVLGLLRHTIVLA